MKVFVRAWITLEGQFNIYTEHVCGPQQVFHETETGFSKMYYFVEHAAGAEVPFTP